MRKEETNTKTSIGQLFRGEGFINRVLDDSPSELSSICESK